jgi:hypothetical protein
MTIDTLAYAKTLEAAGVERRAAEAQAEAFTQHVLPDLLTKADLAATKAELERTIEQAVHRLETALARAVYEQSWRLVGLVFAIVGLLDAILFALLRFSH